MKTLINYFTGSKDMNVAHGKNAIASQVNTIVQQVMSGGGDNVGGNKVCIGSGNKSKRDQVISCQVSTSGDRSPAIKSNGNVVVTYSEDGKSRTVVSQQIQGKGNICSGTGSVTVNGIRMQGSESVTVIDGDVFINKKGAKVEQNKATIKSGKSAEYMAALDNLVTEVRSVFGSKSDKFVEAVNQALDNQESKARLAVLEEEAANLSLHRYPAIMQALSQLIMHPKEGVPVNPKIQKAHDALVDFLAAEMKEIRPDIELIERAKYAIKLLTGQD